MLLNSPSSPKSDSVAGQDFDASKLNADFVKRIPQVGFDRIMLQFKVNKVIKSENGWVLDTQGGVYGTNYLNRALTTAIGLGANRTKDAVYPFGQKDAGGDAYDGANKYVMHFPPGDLPPVDGFWSLTMYDKDFFFVANPINRYSLSARQNLIPNPDGSIDLYIQKDSPGAAKEANWLPAPSGKFQLNHAQDVFAERGRPFDTERYVEGPGRTVGHRLSWPWHSLSIDGTV